MRIALTSEGRDRPRAVRDDDYTAIETVFDCRRNPVEKPVRVPMQRELAGAGSALELFYVD
ncbi:MULTISPECIES: hypothetical protein [unclassified Bradyrhizobium]|uniref:hypothetical protein n=1 Tax=unclassified Bradyrhizobium TaxID=2631580 RepID=UPI00339965B8